MNSDIEKSSPQKTFPSKRVIRLQPDENSHRHADGPGTSEKKHRDHELSGNYAGFRECHILPDWLLVYKVEEDELPLFSPATVACKWLL